MTTYDFDTILDRSGTHAIAIDGIGDGGWAPLAPKPGYDAIPMWVADMNFAAPACITDALVRRASHPAFGYTNVPDECYDKVAAWHARRKGVTDVTRECLGYENGVLGGVASALAAFTAPGDPVLLNSPTYIGFTETLEAMGRRMVLSPLRRDESGTWRMDFDDMDRLLAENHIHAVVFCSPHNPTGRVWERWELEQAMALFEKHQCVVVSDEIWSDLIMPGHAHVATQSVSPWAHENTVALYAPSKTFNLAGLVGSYHVVYDRRLRERMGSVSVATMYNHPNILSVEALMGAYTDEGAEWLDQLLQVLQRNRDLACDRIGERFEGVSCFRPEGTYMLFLDCAGWLKEHGKTLPELERAGWDVGVAWQDGGQFFGPTHIRMNLALPTSRVEEAFDRLDRLVFNA